MFKVNMIKLNQAKLIMAKLNQAKPIMVKLSQAKIFMVKLNYGLNISCKFFNFICQIYLNFFFGK